MSTVRGLVLKNANASNLKRGKKLILGIGINDYQSKEWPRLNNAVGDVRVMTSLLMEKYDFDGCSLLLDKEATRANIENTLYCYTDSNILRQNDSLLVYYSGHGHMDSNQLGYWVPVDAEMGKIHTYIPNGRLRELISNFKCRHVLLISDACFSGSFFAQYKGASIQEEIAEEYERRASRYAFCSGRHDQVVSDGRKGENSPFAKAIIQELDLNNTKINLSRLAERVIDLTRANYNQMPIADPIFETGHMGGQFVFTPRGYQDSIPEAPEEKPSTIILPRAMDFEPKKKLDKKRLWVGAIGLGLLLISFIAFNLFRVRPTKIKAMPSMINLGQVYQNETKEIKFKILNIGKHKATLYPLVVDEQEFKYQAATNQILEPRKEKQFHLIWTARNLGRQSSLIHIRGENIEQTIFVKIQVNVVKKPIPKPKNEPKRVEIPRRRNNATQSELEPLN